MGKIVYIPCRFLNDLPNYYSYKLIYIEDEFTNLQYNKLHKTNKKTIDSAVSIMNLDVYQKDKQVIELWMASQPGFSTMFINVNELISYPDDISALMSQFLNYQVSLAIDDKNI